MTHWGIQITGAIYQKDYKLMGEDFVDKFIDFVELHGWHYGGGFKDVDLDKDPEEEAIK